MALIRKLLGRFAGNSDSAGEAPTPDAPALRERGNAALAAGDLSQAAQWYGQAAAADPRDALAHVNLGFVLLEQGDVAGAQRHLRDALALRRADQNIAHEIHYFLGRSFRAQRDMPRAIDSFEAAVGAAPAFAEAMEELVQLLHESGRHAPALEWARRLQAARPGTESDIVLAQQLHEVGRDAEALQLLDGIVAREPGRADAWTGRGTILLAMDRVHEAVEAFERALSLVGPDADALARAAGALSRVDRFEEALQRVELALRADPAHREALSKRITILVELFRLDAAMEAGRQAALAHPEDADIHWNFSIACLLAGRFEEGWREHEWRWQATGSRARHPLSSVGMQWTGAQDLRGRSILLFAEQGFGDSLQMLRYVPLVAARGAHIVLHLTVGLHGLELTSELAPGVTLLQPGQALPAVDFHCGLMSLPLAFGANEATIPREVPYLRLNPARVQFWQQRLQAAGGRLKVGLVWSGNARHGNDANRSIALAAFASVSQAGCFFVSLQQQLRESDRTAMSAWPELHRWGEELVDFDDTAALVEALDLVISVDTGVAHLAGALGRPAWVLLPCCPDWRWMLDRSDSPWYPTARLFRQHRRKDWSQALASVQEALREAVARQVASGDLAPMATPRPSWPELLDRAQAESDQGRHNAALETLTRADALVGPHPLTLHLRGKVLFAMGRSEEAALAFDAAFSRKPDLVEAAANAGAAWNGAGRPQQALERLEQALRMRPDHVVSLSNRVIALQSLGRGAEAVAAARDAHLKFPDHAELRWTCGATALLNGRFAEGWPALEARWDLPGAGQRPRAGDLACPAWSGQEPVDGRTLLLLSEQGFGDALQFARYAAELTRRGARVVLWVREPLEELMRASMPDCSVVTRREDAAPADFHVPLMSLPLAMGTALESIPAAVPYLRAEAKRVEAWRARLPAGNSLRVGLVCSGNAAHLNDKKRSLPLSSLLRVAVPGVQFVSLQREVREPDRVALQASGMLDFADELRSFADTAALVQALDLVITVDTSVAHLAGGLGAPVWVLLPHRPDWRWLLDRDDSPWYPTARLFRQPAPNDWEPVIDALRAALADYALTARASA